MLTSLEIVNGTAKVPVVLIYFRRTCVLEVLSRIRTYAPDRLFLVADGGRNAQEHAQCLKVRRMVEAAIDWSCQVERLYSDTNLGCRGNIPRGISWAFSQVDRSIILEDDTVPSVQFFSFCEAMLDRYAKEPRVMTVSGSNYLPNHPSFGHHDYTFSGYAETCGYATWSRAWRHYDADMRLWPVAKEAGLLRTGFLEAREQRHWQNAFEQVWNKTCACDPYDFQWLFASWLHGGLSIVPRTNLVTNIGGGPEATHTQEAGHRFLDCPTQDLGWPLIEPEAVVRNAVFDRAYGRFVFYGDPPTRGQKLRAAVVSSLPVPVRSALRRARQAMLAKSL